MGFLSPPDFFSKSTFLKNCFRNTITVSNSLGIDQARHFVVPDLGPNSLQRISADGISRQRVNSLPTKGNFCCLPITVANSLEPDHLTL